jgi:hypothetical protein
MVDIMVARNRIESKPFSFPLDSGFPGSFERWRPSGNAARVDANDAEFECLPTANAIRDTSYHA